MRIRFSPEADLKKWEDRARQEAQRALALDSNLAEAHEALAAIYRNTEFDWERTVAESHRALELNPSLEMPHYYLAAAFYHIELLQPGGGIARARCERIVQWPLPGSRTVFDGTPANQWKPRVGLVLGPDPLLRRANLAG